MVKGLTGAGLGGIALGAVDFAHGFVADGTAGGVEAERGFTTCDFAISALGVLEFLHGGVVH